jgi:hypothetical protein
MLNKEEKHILRILFKNRILASNGQSFEDLFTHIMSYKEKDFQPIRPWGNIGDRKNDGYIKSRGIFYQVFAPEDISKSYPDVIKKLNKDFVGLKSHWSPINEFYFVVNDKYLGVNADSEIEIQHLKANHALKESSFVTAKDLENWLFELKDDEILSIVGSIPDPSKINVLEYSVINDVIDHIMNLSGYSGTNPVIQLPDWEIKIQFNNLSQAVKSILDSASIHVNDLEVYLSNQGNFLSDSLRDKLNEIYESAKIKYSGDELFFSILGIATPKETFPFKNSTLVIMAKYFESCDIFEDPGKSNP